MPRTIITTRWDDGHPLDLRIAEMLERQQQNLLRWPDRNVLKLNIDAGGVQARKIIAE